jgi:serine/threonine-protein kinase
MSASRIDRFEIYGVLAAGGMAEILLGRVVGPSGFERPLVLKRILPHLARDASFIRMFLDEARTVARIRHRNVVHVQELGQDGDNFFLVMEYLEGESANGLMLRAIERGTTLDHALAAYLVAEAAAGLHAAHELVDDEGAPLNVVHRDVSPHNVFVTYDGQVKVIDFGIARTSDSLAARTETGCVKGKFEYMSPEQCRGERLTRQTDVFSLGIVLYELTTGRRLFKREGPLAVFKAICSIPVTPPSRIVANYPRELEAVCLRALARDPKERYATAADFRRDLLAFARSIKPDADCADELAAVMRELFAERITAKTRTLQAMREGRAVEHVPSGEPGFTVQMPTVPLDPGYTETASVSEIAHAVSRERRRTAVAVGAAVLAATALVAGVTTLTSRLRAPALSSAPPPSAATLSSSANARANDDANANQNANTTASRSDPDTTPPTTTDAPLGAATARTNASLTPGADAGASRGRGRTALPAPPHAAGSSASPWAKWH